MQTTTTATQEIDLRNRIAAREASQTAPFGLLAARHNALYGHCDVSIKGSTARKKLAAISGEIRRRYGKNARRALVAANDAAWSAFNIAHAVMQPQAAFFASLIRED